MSAAHASTQGRHELVPLAAPGAWRQALAGIPHAFAHTWESCRAMAATTGDETCLYRFEGEDGERVVCPLALRTGGGTTDVVTPFGFSGFVGTGDCPGFPRAWAAHARQRGWVCGYVALDPRLGSESYHEPADRFVHNSLYVLDLTRSEGELFATLSENRRREVRRGAPEIVLDREALAAFFLARAGEFFAGRGAGPAYAFTRETLALLFAAGCCLPIGVATGGRLEAVSVFASTPFAGDFLFNVSLPAGRRHSAALLWEGMMRLKALGVPSLNLGGGIRPGDGVARFKERFGARRLPFVCLKQVYDPPAYERACRRAGVDPRDRTGYFPPYRAAGIATPERAAAPLAS